MLARFDLINLISNTHDDAFYYFQIARNLAEGKFSTFDSGITHTNGYHAIWLLLITPFHWAFDKEAALFPSRCSRSCRLPAAWRSSPRPPGWARMPWVLMFAALPMLYDIPS